jgi:hypothetical protein
MLLWVGITVVNFEAFWIDLYLFFAKCQNSLQTKCTKQMNAYHLINNCSAIVHVRSTKQSLIICSFFLVLGFRKDEYLNKLKTSESCLYFYLCSNQVKYIVMEAQALASPKIARHVHRLLGHCVVSSNWVLNYSNKATSFIPNLLFLLKNVTHTASFPFLLYLHFLPLLDNRPMFALLSCPPPS